MKWRTAHTNTISFEKRKFGQNCHSLSVLVIRCHRLSLVVACSTTCCHSLSLVVTWYTTRCHSLSFVITRCHSLYHSLYHSLSLVVPLVVTRYHSLSLVITRWSTRLSFYKRSVFICFFIFLKVIKQLFCKCNCY